MRGAVALTALVAAAAGCSLEHGDGGAGADAARRSEAAPLYWLGERFEGLELEHVDVRNPNFVLLVYGTCEIDDPDGILGPEGGSCAPPLQLQISPLCAHLEAVARAPIWRRRTIRGAPVGTIDSAPVLFTSRVQVKVYQGQGSDPGLALRALRALRSANDVEPVLRRSDPIPGPPPGVLAGRTPCGAR